MGNYVGATHKSPSIPILKSSRRDDNITNYSFLTTHFFPYIAIFLRGRFVFSVKFCIFVFRNLRNYEQQTKNRYLTGRY
jgi:nitrate reductase NapE component